jgi:RNA-directed DNA polymerase
MRLQDVLMPICTSLSLCDWDADALEHHLKSRLPRRLSRMAGPMAHWLSTEFPKSVAPDAHRIFRAIRESGKGDSILAHARKTAAMPAPPLASPAFRPTPGLAHLPLPPLDTPGALADWLALPADQLVRFSDPRGLSALNPSHFAQHYRPHLIPKSDGCLRLIEEPKPILKRLQRRILSGILNHVPPHDAAFGFRQGRNCIAAAARHAGEPVVVSFDLADFFPAIPYARLYGLFRSLGYPRYVALALTNLCTTITPPVLLRTPLLAARDTLSNRHLPQGAPTSPALANLCALALDHRLSGLAKSLDAHYTRYADDLTFSGDAHIAALLTRAVPEILREERFRLNAAKTRVMPHGTCQTVTGIVVNQHTNIRRADYDRLKSTLHHLRKPTDPRRADPAFLARLSGQIAWVEAVNLPRGHRLREALAHALDPNFV